MLAHPAGAGSIPTSAGQEDFNSMGAFAALKARTALENAAHVIATELVCAVPGAGVPPPAAHARRRWRSALARVRARVPRLEEDRSLAAELAGLARRAANGGGGAGVRCKGWQQEAALLMLENNLHPDVAEKPEELVVYGGIGKAARNREALAAIKRELQRAGATRDAARAVRQAGRRVRDPRGRAARADRQLQPRAATGRTGTSSASSTPPG